MAKRFIDTDLFRKPFMRGLEAPYKALWIYLLCECDHAGIWVVELDVAQIRMGMKLDPAKAIEKMQGAVIEIDGGAKWFLPDFVSFQYGTLNPANRVHASVIERLSASGIDLENKPLTSPFQGAKDKEKDKDKAKEKEKEKEKDTREPEIEILIWPTFKDWFDLYAKRRDMGECETIWAKLDQATHELIYRHTEAYVKAQPDKLYRKDPIRYLKKQGWKDEVIQAKPTNGRSVKTAEEHTAGVAAATAALLARRRNEREHARAHGLHNDQAGAGNPNPIPSGEVDREG